MKHGCKSCRQCPDFREAQTAFTLSGEEIELSSIAALLYEVGQSLARALALPSSLRCFIFFRSSLFLSALGVSAKEAHMQCVSDSAEILMFPSVGGWYRACIVTVQRVPSRHQALLAKLLNE